jgi:hypothetical protein
MKTLLSLLSTSLLVTIPLLAQAQDRATGPVNFSQDILPILSNKCFVCHGPSVSDPDQLRLDTEQTATADRGGYRAIDHDRPEKSALLERITSKAEPMPPVDAEKQLTAGERELLSRWIREGGSYTTHWAFVGPRIQPPRSRPAAERHEMIDAFIKDGLQEAGIDFAPEASRATLARRVALVLTGLPPELEQLQQFLDDKRSDAYEHYVDSLLASPRYGEHQARYWLDAVRYGDTHGLHLDNRRGIYPYRDWVVDALNKNLPLDQFITWQLAGDLLPDPTLGQLVATGFVRMNPSTAEGGAIPAEFQAKNNFDRTETLGTVLLGMTLTCARCHSHKYDPVSQTEYYQLLAFFNSTAEHSMDGNSYTYKPILKAPQDQAAWTQWNQLESQRGQLISEAQVLVNGDLELPDPLAKQWLSRSATEKSPLTTQPSFRAAVTARLNTEKFKPALARSVRFTILATNGSQPCIDELEIWSGDTNVALSSHGSVASCSSSLPGHEIHQLKHVHDGQYGNRRSWISNETGGGWVQIDLPATVQIDRILWGRDREGKFQDRVATRYRIEVSVEPGKWQVVATGDDRLPMNPSTPAVLQNNSKTRLAMLADPKGPFATTAVHAKAVTLSGQIAAAEKGFTTTLVAQDLPKPRTTKLLRRGEYHLPVGEALEPGVPQVMGKLPEQAPRNRLGLAQWLTDSRHPLVARVLVNRIWQRTLGDALVRTPEDFGLQGQQPTHPELLDWLALDLQKSGWNLKSVLKNIVTSQTFRQVSNWRTDVDDPANQLFARGPRYRLDAEVLRDIGLWAGGLLDPHMGGEGVKPYQPAGMWKALAHPGSNTKQYVQDKGQLLYRRSLYVYWKRTSPHPMMTLFDAPDRESSCVKRSRTNTALQSLGLLNETQRVEMARALAERLLTTADTDAKRLDVLFRLVSSRSPSAQETVACLGLLKTMRARYTGAEKEAEALLSTADAKRNAELNLVDHAAWTQVTVIVLASDPAILLY